MSCTTEIVLEGLRSAIDNALVARYGTGRRCYRDAEYPEALQSEQTPAVVIIEGDQRFVEPGQQLEQDITLIVKVMAGEYTRSTVTADDPGAYVGGPKIMPLLNETGALIEELLLDTATNWRGVPVYVVPSGASKYAGQGEALLEWRGTLSYPRLAATALGL